MLSEKMEKALNSQINAELYSAYMYLAMAAYFEQNNLSGFANWMRVQFQEEQMHAMKLFDYVFERGGKVTLTAIEAPPSQWKSPQDVFEATLEHEQKVTGLIDDLVRLARDLKDTATEIFLQWYVTEQVEEEDSAGRILNWLTMSGGSPQALFMLDRELGQRSFTPPVAKGEE
ncbi:MAG TPA: ferritin [Anaerohalosphaeraceae bacterium]|jgi:ferritin|nr:ferritin [Anaerohalosphaeraceae bacterium]HRT49706.1 ferritin [Anaerohalosphaeraceae bacterium]HRT87642.1 ferritin [Anaerohalosphaeraceae bacterium]